MFAPKENYLFPEAALVSLAYRTMQSLTKVHASVGPPTHYRLLIPCQSNEMKPVLDDRLHRTKRV